MYHLQNIKHRGLNIEGTPRCTLECPQCKRTTYFKLHKYGYLFEKKLCGRCSGNTKLTQPTNVITFSKTTFVLIKISGLAIELST